MSVVYPEKINICGVQFDPITLDNLHQAIADAVREHKHTQILHVNVHGINLAQHDHQLRKILNSAPITFCDGFGVRLGARILGHRTPPRITYADWMWQLAEFAQMQGFSFFLLGARPGIVERASCCLQKRFPRLMIAGIHHGYFDKTPRHPENEAVLQRINDVKPDILIVAFGMPLQEYWVHENWERIDAHIALTGGAVFDYVSGELQRGPDWMTRNGLEWLARLIIEPRRLWQRYLLGNPTFLWNVIRQRLTKRRFY